MTIVVVAPRDGDQQARVGQASGPGPGAESSRAPALLNSFETVWTAVAGASMQSHGRRSRPAAGQWTVRWAGGGRGAATSQTNNDIIVITAR